METHPLGSMADFQYTHTGCTNWSTLTGGCPPVTGTIGQHLLNWKAYNIIDSIQYKARTHNAVFNKPIALTRYEWWHTLMLVRQTWIFFLT